MTINSKIPQIKIDSTPEPDFPPLVRGNEFLPSISPWMTWGGLLLTTSVGIAIALSGIIKYNIIIKTQGTVRPTGELRLVQAKIEGSVKTIFAQENQPVKKGDIIAKLDDSKMQTQKSELQSQISQAKLQLTQINAQIESINTQIFAETDRSRRGFASAKAELSHSQRDYQDKKITTSSEVQEAQANLKSSFNEWQKAHFDLASARANLQSTEASLEAAQTKFTRYGEAYQSGVLSFDQLGEVQLAVKQQKQAVQSQKATVKAQQETVSQRQQAVEAAKAKLQRAKASLNPTQADVVVATERISQEMATGKATLATLAKEREALIGQKIETQKQLDRNLGQLQQLKLDLNQATIRATADGIIGKLNLRNPDQTVRSGEEIAQIVPIHVPLVIKATISPQDIGKIEIGQRVQMRVSACPYPDYGTLNGVVSQVSQDAVKTTNTTATNAIAPSPPSTQTTAFYEVTIKPNSLVFGRNDHQCTVQLGMEGRADIVAKQETFLQFFLRKARLISDF